MAHSLPDLAPIARAERLDHVDAIRGLALFGVLLVNLYTHAELVLTEASVAAMPTAAIDPLFGFVIEVLWEGKAQALFSMLFGFGFALQMQRLSARGADATAVYLRRLGILLVLGFAHLFLVFIGDILHLYALMGFALLLARPLSDRVLLWAGLALSILAWPVFHLWLAASAPPGGDPPLEQVWAQGVVIRDALFRGNDYPAFVAEAWRGNFAEYLATPMFATFCAYVFGRFLLGYWVARRGFLTDPDAHAALLSRLRPQLLWGGLAMSLAARSLISAGDAVPSAAEPLVSVLDEASKLVLAAGYALWIVHLVRAGLSERLTRGLGAVGRMALTNYLAHSLVYLFVLYGFGLGLLPYTGALVSLALALGVFALQIALSRWWLARRRFGPAEYLWRWATYGRRPPG
jgi:uncharacterized protein